MSCVALIAVLCGNVKNVGFRRQVWRNAKLLNLSGFVANVEERDCVSIYAEGGEEDLRKFLVKIESLANTYGALKTNAVLNELPCKEFKDFEIYGCLNDLAKRGTTKYLLTKIDEMLRLKCEDYTS